jgi:hypothetical protein
MPKNKAPKKTTKKPTEIDTKDPGKVRLGGTVRPF